MHNINSSVATITTQRPRPAAIARGDRDDTAGRKHGPKHTPELDWNDPVRRLAVFALLSHR
jgi:hypothetical protein